MLERRHNLHNSQKAHNRMLQSLVILFIATIANAIDQAIYSTESIIVREGQYISLQSPGYPNVPPVGTKTLWFIRTELPDQHLKLICTDLRITSSENCRNGYLMVKNGDNDKKYCGSESDLTVTSINNKLNIEFDLNWAVGVANCEIRGIGKNQVFTVQQEPVTTETLNPSTTVTPEIVDEVRSQYEADEENIELTAEGVPYIGIYRNPITSINKKWNFVAKEGSVITLHCNDLVLKECSDTKLLINTGNFKKEICSSKIGEYTGFGNYNITTTTNRLSVRLEANVAGSGGRIDCIVSVTTGAKPFEYLNRPREILDTTVFGITAGSRATDCDCGRSRKDPGRIIRGDEVKLGEYPWMTAIVYYGFHAFCGGSIITKHHILSAAHCFKEFNETKHMEVYVGTVNNSNVDQGQRLKVTEIIKHHNYTEDFNYNDIAVLLLQDAIIFSNFIGPICLPSSQPQLNNQIVTVMGWGHYGYIVGQGWLHSEQLLKTFVRIVDINTCSYRYGRKLDYVIPKRICTWDPKHDTCSGDSGGPVVWLDPETNRYTLVGLISMGYGCRTEYPKLHTNVAFYYPWIQQVVTKTMPGSQTCKKI